MKRRTLTSSLAAVLLVVGSTGLATDGTGTIRLLYHSDTQGYYRPCG